MFSISVGSKESVWLTIAAPGTAVLLHPVLDYPSFKSKLGFGIGQGPAGKIGHFKHFLQGEFYAGIDCVVIEKLRYQERMLS